MVKKEAAEKPTLQAVVVADHFDKHFIPLLSSDRPWSSVQLANSSLIDYTLEWLSRTEVSGVIVVVSQENFDQVNSLLRPWSWRFASWTIVQCQNCMSLGDALREVDSRALISGDFLLVQAGVLCASSLQPQIDAHRARRKKNKDNVMTLIYAEVGDGGSAVRQVIGLESESQRLVIYHKESDCTKLDVEKKFFFNESQIRRNVRDSGIAICSPQICPQFASNPDFEHRDAVVREILANEEVLCQNIHVEILAPTVFALAIKDYGTYLAANRFILKRWSYPLVPDGLSTTTATRYVCRKGKVYIPVDNHQITAIDRDATVGPNVIMGCKSEVKSKATVKNSTIGDNCVIDSNTVIDNCVVGQKSIIGGGCNLQHSVIGERVKIGSGCIIGPRCIIGANVTLPADTVLPPGVVICASKPPSDEEDLSSIPFTNGAFRWTLKAQGGFWSDPTKRKKVTSETSGDDSMSNGDSDDDKRDDGDQPDGAGPQIKPPQGQPEEAADGSAMFFEEVLESMQRGAEENTPIKNLIVEINSSKFANNVLMEEVARCVMKVILTIGRHSATDASSLFSSLKKLFGKWKPLLDNYYQPKQSQIQALLAIEDEAKSREQLYGPCLKNILHYLYEQDVLHEDAILEWYQGLDEKLKPKLSAFVEWLQQSEEDSDED